MTGRTLRDHLIAYAAGLEAEVALLRHVHRLALDQRAATDAHVAERLSELTAERTELMAGLERLEAELQPSRQALAEAHHDAAQLPGFDDVAALHRHADAIVARILHADQETVEALSRAEAARRAASHELDAGETTLAAYRRVIAPDGSAPALVDRRG